MLQSMRSQRVRHDLVTEQPQQFYQCSQVVYYLSRQGSPSDVICSNMSILLTAIFKSVNNIFPE